MMSFREWLAEQAGQVVGTNFNDAPFQEKGVRSKYVAPGAVPEESGLNPDCQYLGVGCGKKKRREFINKG